MAHYLHNNFSGNGNNCNSYNYICPEQCSTILYHDGGGSSFQRKHIRSESFEIPLRVQMPDSRHSVRASVANALHNRLPTSTVGILGTLQRRASPAAYSVALIPMARLTCSMEQRVTCGDQPLISCFGLGAGLKLRSRIDGGPFLTPVATGQHQCH